MSKVKSESCSIAEQIGRIEVVEPCSIAEGIGGAGVVELSIAEQIGRIEVVEPSPSAAEWVDRTGVVELQSIAEQIGRAETADPRRHLQTSGASAAFFLIVSLIEPNAGREPSKLAETSG